MQMSYELVTKRNNVFSPLPPLRFLSKEFNTEHKSMNLDLIAENKCLQETITILNNDNQVLSE